MAKTFSFTDEQITALKAAISGQLGALNEVGRIYLAPKFHVEVLQAFLEGLESAADAGSGGGQTVDAYTKTESDNKYLAKTDAESTYQKKTDAFTQTTADGKRKRTMLEVDFVCNQGYKRLYIQSAYALPTQEKMEQELKSLTKINDSFMKYVIVGTPTPTYQNDDGVVIMNIYDFLMNDGSLLIF